jgi:hypothetical protein
MEFNVFHVRALYYTKTLFTNKCTKRVLSSIVTHSYMFRPCWVKTCRSVLRLMIKISLCICCWLVPLMEYLSSPWASTAIKKVIHSLWLKKYAKSLCCNLEFFWRKAAKFSKIENATLTFNKTGIQPLDKKSIPDFTLEVSNASMHMHWTLTGLDASPPK